MPRPDSATRGRRRPRGTVAGSRLFARTSIAALVMLACTAWSAAAACIGDCSASRRVTVSDLVTAVSIALGLSPLTACTAADADGDGHVSIGELIAAVNSALSGCPGSATFRGLGHVPGGSASFANGISADGTVVIGNAIVGGLHTGFRWHRDTGAVALGTVPTTVAYAVDAAGATIVGQVLDDFGELPFRWTTDGGLERLPLLTEAHTAGWARDVSAAGSVVIGSTGSLLFDSRAVLWDPPGEPRAIAGEGTQGLIITPDGSIAAGRDLRTGVGFRWDAVSGAVDLGTPDGGSGSAPMAISHDGSVICGESSAGTHLLTFCWRAGEGAQALPNLPGGTADSDFGLGMSADGSVVVGSNEVGEPDAQIPVAVLWDSQGVYAIADLLQAHGVDLQGWRLDYASDVTPDGQTIVGGGRAPDGSRMAWIAFLPR